MNARDVTITCLNLRVLKLDSGFLLSTSEAMLLLRFSSLPPRLSCRVACYSKMSTTPGPICRKFVPVEQSEVTSISETDGFKFRLVSYNILAQAYVKSAYFQHSPAPSLKVTFLKSAYLSLPLNIHLISSCVGGKLVRRPFSQFLRDLKQISFVYSAELIIEEKIDYNDLVATVEDGNTSSLNNGNKLLVGGNKEEPKAEKDSQADRGDPNDPRVRLKRDCVGTMAAFRLKNPTCHHVIIANTHLYWDPEWADVKIAQAKYLLSRLAEFKMLVSKKFDCSPSIIVAGDFNSIPGDQVYKYLVSGTNPTGLETANDLPIPLSSVYAFARGEPEFTNCTPGFTGTLDYIFYSPSEGIKPVTYLELPGTESPDVSGGLPNYFHPSDHLPIGAEFEVEA